MYDSSSSDTDDEVHTVAAKPIGTGIVGDPYCKCQGAFLSNMVKMLNESETTCVNLCMRWHPKIRNAMQVNWQAATIMFHSLHPVLSRYKLCRRNNGVRCARSTWNRKLREWSFDMVHTGGEWTSYIYRGEEFSKQTSTVALPWFRR